MTAVSILQLYVVLDVIICILTKQLTNKLTNQLTHSLTESSRVLFKNLAFFQLIKKIAAYM